MAGVEAGVETLGGERSYVMLRDVLLSADASSITFSAVPQQFRHLELTGVLRSDRAATNDDVFVRVNSDIGPSYYSNLALITHANTVTTSEQVAQTAMRIANVAGDTAPSNVFSSVTLRFPDYANNSRLKECVASGFALTTTSTGGSRIVSGGGVWGQTSPVSTVQVYPANGANWKAGSRLTLFGLSA